MSRRRKTPANSRAAMQDPAASDPGERTGTLLHVIIACVLVACVVAAVHWPVLKANALNIDDDDYLIRNRLVQTPSWASTGRFLSEVLKPSTVPGYYQPLAMISLMLDVARGASPANLRPFRETSLALHVANTCLIIVILSTLFHRVLPAALVGLLFGVHPMTVEPVAWLADRKTTLAAFCALWSVWFYLRYARMHRRSAYVLCAVAYILALMSKPTTTLLPGALLLMDFWPLRRLSWRSVLEKIPLGVITAVSSIITIISQARSGRIQLPSDGATVPVVLAFLHNVAFYPCKMLWPVNLTPLYAKPDPVSLANPLLMLMVVGAVVLMAALVLSLRWTRSLLASWLIFLCLVFPTMSGIGFTVAIASDKYVYLPVIGFLMGLCWLASRAYDGLLRRGPAAACAVLVIPALLLGTAEAAALRAYLPYWRDTKTLETYMVQRAPKAPLIHYNLGFTHAAREEWPEAIACFKRTIELDPNYLTAYNNLGVVMIRLNHLPEAVDCLERALRIAPADPLAHQNLGTALMLMGRVDRAIAEFEQAAAIRPDAVQVHSNYGYALQHAGRNQQAIEHLAKSLQLGDRSPRTYNVLGLALAACGRPSEAIQNFRTAAQLAPNWPEPAQNAARLAASMPAAP